MSLIQSSNNKFNHDSFAKTHMSASLKQLRDACFLNIYIYILDQQIKTFLLNFNEKIKKKINGKAKKP